MLVDIGRLILFIGVILFSPHLIANNNLEQNLKDLIENVKKTSDKNDVDLTFIWKHFKWRKTAEFIKIKENDKSLESIMEALGVKLMSTEEIKKAKYVIYGTLENFESDEKDKYHFYIYIVDLNEETIVETSRFVFSNISIDRMKIETERFFYVKSSDIKQLKTDSEKPAGKVRLNKELDAVILESVIAYEEEKYDQSYKLINKAIYDYNYGQTITNYEIQYLSGVKSGQKGLTRNDLINKLFEDGGLFETKLFFKPNKSELDSKKTEEWISDIAKIAKDKKDKCIIIHAHSSKQGDEERNKELSERRAKKIKQLFLKNAKNLDIETYGHGEKECKVCTEPDSDENQRDRRIELEILQSDKCKPIAY